MKHILNEFFFLKYLIIFFREIPENSKKMYIKASGNQIAWLYHLYTIFFPLSVLIGIYS